MASPYPKSIFEHASRYGDYDLLVFVIKRSFCYVVEQTWQSLAPERVAVERYF